jgi:hypothetical protein
MESRRIQQRPARFCQEIREVSLLSQYEAKMESRRIQQRPARSGVQGSLIK